MRSRMLRELATMHAGFDIKLDAGGLTDIEFLVQYWILLHAHRHPSLAEHTGNAGALGALADAGLVAAEAAGELTDIYRRYLARSQRLTLEGWNAAVPDEELRAARELVQARWRETLGGFAAG